MKNDPRTETLWKTYLWYFLILIFGIAIIAKIIIVQAKDKETQKQLSVSHDYHYDTLKAVRGNIYSSDGQLMATTIPYYDAWFDYASVHPDTLAKHIDTLCNQMARVLTKRNATEWKNYLEEGKSRNNRNNKIALNITLEEFRQVQQFEIFKKGRFKGGFKYEEKIRRKHPYNELANIMIGDIYDKNGYHYGIEEAYNSYLKGQDGIQLVRRINNGYMPVEDAQNADAKNGDDVITTFDIKLQDIVENSLNKALTENKAEKGCAILMDVKTGYVKAIANLALNHKTGQYEETCNVALSERYEPGSVFKIASMLVLLNHNEKLTLDHKVRIGIGPMKFSNRTMRDDHTFAKDGECTLQEVIEQSSNKGTAVLITRYFAAHPEKYVEGLRALGLGNKIGTGLAQEVAPVVRDPSSPYWSKVSLPWMSIGYEVNVTPLQLVTLYNGIANGGCMMKPQFVSEIRRGTQTIEKFDPIVLNERIASPESIKKIQAMLEGVTIRGTAKRQFEGCMINVAGKTGTAQYYDSENGMKYNYHEPGIGRKLYNTTFVGYFPAEQPQYTCIVMISRARGRFWAAGSVSAPGFREIAEKVYAMYIGQQDDDSLAIVPSNASDPIIVRHDKEINYLNGLSKDFNDYAFNNGWVTVEQTEDGETRLREAKLPDNIVPNVIGMDITDAVYLLENMGVRTEFVGQGKVKEQSLHAGDTLKPNSVIQLKLEKK